MTLPGVYNTNSVENREEYSDSLASSLPFTRELDPKTHELLRLRGQSSQALLCYRCYVHLLCTDYGQTMQPILYTEVSMVD